MMHVPKNNKQSQQAFSFMEVIISLFVLSVGFLGVIGLVTKTLQNSFLQRDTVIASMLAQEGVELVYNIRDTNLARGNDAFAGITDSDSYRIDATSTGHVSLDGNSDYVLKKDSNGFFGYTGTTNTKFRRKIIVEGAGDTRDITSVTVWGSGGFPVNISSGCTKAAHCVFTKTTLQKE